MIVHRHSVWAEFRCNKPAVAGLIILIVIALLAVIGPDLNPYTHSEQNLALVNQPPSSQYWFGTDALGRDLFTRVWYGARLSLLIGVISAFFAVLIGTAYGGLSGYLGGWIDEVMMRFIEVLSSIPFILWVILLMVLLEPGLNAMILAMALTTWLTMARIVRGQVLTLKEQQFVQAARVLGAGPLRVLTRHLIPNMAGPIIVTLTLTIPEIIFTEAWLSFLGLGVPPPHASLGSLAQDGVEGLRNYPWQLFFPALLISITILAFNFVGDGLRDALDPNSD